MTYVQFGNLSVSELEFRLGISFSEEHLTFLNETRTDIANFKNEKNAANLWHGFDAPFKIHCGSKMMFEKMKTIIETYMTDGCFPKKGTKIGISYDLLEEEKFGYNERQRMLNENLEIYVGVEVGQHMTKTKFYVKTKETAAGNIFLQEVKQTRSPGYTNQMIVPNVDEVQVTNTYKKDENGEYILIDGMLVVEGYVPVAPIRKKKTEDNTYTIKDFWATTTIKPWDGNPIKYEY